MASLGFVTGANFTSPANDEEMITSNREFVRRDRASAPRSSMSAHDQRRSGLSRKRMIVLPGST